MSRGAAREWLVDQDAASGFTVSALALSPCGGFVALIGSAQCCVRAWEPSSRLGPPLAQWDTGLAGDGAVGAFFGGGRLALGDDAGTLQVWDLRASGDEGRPLLDFSAGLGEGAVTALSAVAWGAPRGGGLLAAALSSGVVRVVEVDALGVGSGVAAGAVHTLGGRGAVEQGDKYGRVPRGGGPPRAGKWAVRGVAFAPGGRALFVLESAPMGGALLAKWRLLGAVEARARGRVEGAVEKPGCAEVWVLAATSTPSRTPLDLLFASFSDNAAAVAAAVGEGGARLPPRPESGAVLALAGGLDGRVLFADPDTLSVVRATPVLFAPEIPATAVAVAPTARLLVAGTFASVKGGGQRSNLRLEPLPGRGVGRGSGLGLRACVLLLLLLFVAAAGWGWLAIVRVARSELEAAAPPEGAHAFDGGDGGAAYFAEPLEGGGPEGGGWSDAPTSMEL